MTELTPYYKLSKEILSAQRMGKAIVVLESTVITHGLPRPENLALAQELEDIVRDEGAYPATVGVLDGRVLVGMESDELEKLANDESAIKLSSRDLATAIAQSKSGGTTVAGTLRIAAQAGLRVFATGGIGGVHRGSTWDVSADLLELAKQPLIVVCAGAKSILDLSASLEKLETLAVPVIGYKTLDFPAFYSIKSGLKLNGRVDSPREAVELAQAHWKMGGRGIVLAQPPPKESAVSTKEMEAWTKQALEEAGNKGVQGQEATPFLLKRVSELSEGKSLKANLALLRNNAKLAAKISQEMLPQTKHAGLIPRKA